MNIPNKRRLALATGAKFYNTGRECINGHISKRYTHSAQCFQCRVDYRKKSSYKEYQRAFQLEYRNDPANKSRMRIIQVRYHIKTYYKGDEERYNENQRIRAINKEKRDGRQRR